MLDIEFPVLFSEKLPGVKLIAEAISVGSPVELRPEPENSFDESAVAVYYEGIKLGYLPNRGTLCPSCWGPYKGYSISCPNCGRETEQLVEGGLARRFLELTSQLTFAARYRVPCSLL